MEGFFGFLHADGYAGYHKLPKRIRVAGCLSHARHKFDEALTATPKEARAGSLTGAGKTFSERSVGMGRKNWLFANTPAGARSSAVIYSIIETAKENGLDPYRYLLWILRTAPSLAKDGDNREKQLLPQLAPKGCFIVS